jgi:hypothetical protein
MHEVQDVLCNLINPYLCVVGRNKKIAKTNKGSKYYVATLALGS